MASETFHRLRRRRRLHGPFNVRPPVVLLACTPPSRTLRQTAGNDAVSVCTALPSLLGSYAIRLNRPTSCGVAGGRNQAAISYLLSAYAIPPATRSIPLLLACRRASGADLLSSSAAGSFSSCSRTAGLRLEFQGALLKLAPRPRDVV